MASNYTENYKLPLWEGGDSVLREEFNEAHEKVDAALGSMPKIKLGHYTGTGQAGQRINVGFQPLFVILLCYDNGTRYIGVLTEDVFYYATSNVVGDSSTKTTIYLTETGFCLPTSVYNSASAKGTYIAIG